MRRGKYINKTNRPYIRMTRAWREKPVFLERKKNIYFKTVFSHTEEKKK